ncbi:major facilitator superfamily domain-containing protein [Apodospora peruviana]|uniref:Major facilitator superfamily domain-containing protein n=1 Tax=Apodospora peruviana TaxID=516989 RepID=A0AAE0HXI4_9PEZI|nr:major facilitator superfamily domain-containing protein [Apodospora peruviana]
MSDASDVSDSAETAQPRTSYQREDSVPAEESAQQPEEAVQAVELEAGSPKGSTESIDQAAEPRQFRLVNDDEAKEDEEPVVEQKSFTSNRASVLSTDSMALSRLFHLRESIQFSVPAASPSIIEHIDSDVIPDSQAEVGGSHESIHTLAHGDEIPDELTLSHSEKEKNQNQKLEIVHANTTTNTDKAGNNIKKEDAQIHRDSFSSVELDDGEPIIVAWEENDPENPYNWSPRKKAGVLATSVMLIMNSTMGSSLPSNAIPFITAEWGVTSKSQMVLPISVYLIGYVMGPILWAPLSEQYGRKKLTVGTFIMFSLSTLACALAPTWAAFLIFRLLCGIFASAPIAIVTGIIADIYGDPRTRGRSMGIFMASTVFGPLLAPIISGFSATAIGWRWAFWIALIYAGATMIPLAIFPETFGPVLLLRRARAIRHRDPSARVIAPHEFDKRNLTELTTVVLTRPIRMIIFEPIVNTTCAYIALCYAIFYMSFEAFPIIFQGVYGLSPGQCGLTYLAIGAGSVLALPIFWTYDNFLRRAQSQNAAWTHQEEYRRLPLACIGGPMFVISLFWLGWTSRNDIHFVVPMLAGIPFGIGFMCIFQALLNYLTDAYEIFAASAHAATSCSRSLLATVLPLAASPMFATLEISGACSLLGGLSLLMCAIPFVFLWQGEKIRANSKFCLALRQRKEEMARKIDEQRKRLTAVGTVLPSRSSGPAAKEDNNNNTSSSSTSSNQHSQDPMAGKEEIV